MIDDAEPAEGEQAGVGDEVHLLVRENALTIASDGAFRKFRGNLLGDGKRFCVVVDSGASLARKGGGRNSMRSSSIVASAAVMRCVSPSTRRRQLQGWLGGATPLRR